jgi:cytochrome c
MSLGARWYRRIFFAASCWGGSAVLLLSASALAAEGPPLPQKASQQVKAGAIVFKQHCAQCHGAQGQGAQAFARPIWGKGSTISKFGTAQGLTEYVVMMMPFDDPKKLKESDKTAVVAYMLVRNKSLQATVTLQAGGNHVAIK